MYFIPISFSATFPRLNTNVPQNVSQMIMPIAEYIINFLAGSFKIPAAVEVIEDKDGLQ